jgi:hypothetical protein
MTFKHGFADWAVATTKDQAQHPLHHVADNAIYASLVFSERLLVESLELALDLLALKDRKVRSEINRHDTYDDRNE